MWVGVYVHAGGAGPKQATRRVKAGHAKGDSKGATPRVLAHAPLGFSRRFCSAKICPTRGSDRGGRARAHTHTHTLFHISINLPVTGLDLALFIMARQTNVMHVLCIKECVPNVFLVGP